MGTNPSVKPDKLMIGAPVSPEFAEILTPGGPCLRRRTRAEFWPAQAGTARTQSPAPGGDRCRPIAGFPARNGRTCAHERVDRRPDPADLTDRRVEITGPVDRKMVINALNSGASVFMADFEDSNSPTWANNIEGQINLRDAIAGDDCVHQSRGQRVRAERPRPRSCWCGRAAGIWWRSMSRVERTADLGLAVRFRPVLLPQRQGADGQGHGPYFYLPKMESHLEARLWNDVFIFAQDYTGRSARHDPRDGADRNHSRRVRDGRDSLRAARPFGGAELRALGLHFQLHQEVPQSSRRSCCRTAPRSRWSGIS